MYRKKTNQEILCVVQEDRKMLNTMINTTGCVMCYGTVDCCVIY